jgi:hypothetical protein
MKDYGGTAAKKASISTCKMRLIALSILGSSTN